MKHLSYIFILLCMVLTSCERRPENVIPPDEMEEILFDYHLTQGIIDIQPPESYEHNQRYLDAVFSNHGVTEAQFDSSMLWYTRQAFQLRDIYTNLNRRFTELESALKLEAGNSDITLGLSASGDTANIWTSGSTIILRPSPLQNRFVFTIPNDSTLFLRRDRLRLLANSVFFRENSEDRNSVIEVGLTLEYKGGRTIGMNRTVNSNSPIELSIDAGSEDDIRALHGFFYYAGSNEQRNLAILTGIALVRMHDKTALPPADSLRADSLKADSLRADSLKADSTGGKPKVREHLTPEQLLERNRTEERIKIKTAPDVRTKNSYGPTRRKKKSPQNSGK